MTTPFWLAQAAAVAEEGSFFERLSWPTLMGIVAIFLLINGFFVAAEFAVVRLRPTYVEEVARAGSRGAKSVSRIKRRVNDFHAASQLGVTLASLLLGAAGEAMFRTPLRQMGISAPVALTALSLFLMTILHVVVGEQGPKMLALRSPAAVAFFAAPITEVFMRLCRPLIWMLAKMTDLLLKPLGGGPKGAHADQELYSEGEIQDLLDLREKAGLAEQAESVMISRVFSFFDMVATEIMVPRTEMTCIQNTDSLKELVKAAAEYHHERYPVYGKDLDDIRGVVLVKDLIEAMSRNPALDASVTTLMREVLCVPGSLSVFQLMSSMQKNRTRVAVVLDEFGGTAGMVTYGDILERIVGVVEESNKSSVSLEDIIQLSENLYRVSGLTLIKDFEVYFELTIDDDHNDTIGGTVFSLLGRKPQIGDEVELTPFRFRVESLDGLRIDNLKVERLVSHDGDSGEDISTESSTEKR